MFACFSGFVPRGPKIPDQYSRPSLYGLSNRSEKIDLKKLKRLIHEGKLVPCFPGAEEPQAGPEINSQRALVRKILRSKGVEDTLGDTLEECPICFLHYLVLNTSRCCSKRVCTECFLQVQTSVPPNTSPTCPFCKVPNYTSKFVGAKSEEEQANEWMEEQKLIESRIREREQQHQQQQDEETQARLLQGEQDLLNEEQLQLEGETGVANPDAISVVLADEESGETNGSRPPMALASMLASANDSSATSRECDGAGLPLDRGRGSQSMQRNRQDANSFRVNDYVPQSMSGIALNFEDINNFMLEQAMYESLLAEGGEPAGGVSEAPSEHGEQRVGGRPPLSGTEAQHNTPPMAAVGLLSEPNGSESQHSTSPGMAVPSGMAVPEGMAAMAVPSGMAAPVRMAAMAVPEAVSPAVAVPEAVPEAVSPAVAGVYVEEDQSGVGVAAGAALVGGAVGMAAAASERNSPQPATSELPSQASASELPSQPATSEIPSQPATCKVPSQASARSALMNTTNPSEPSNTATLGTAEQPIVTASVPGGRHSALRAVLASAPGVTAMDAAPTHEVTPTASATIPEVTAGTLAANPEVTAMDAAPPPEVTAIAAAATPTATPEVTALDAATPPEVTAIAAAATPEVTAIAAESPPEVTAIAAEATPEVTAIAAEATPEVTAIAAAASLPITATVSTSTTAAVHSDQRGNRAPVIPAALAGAAIATTTLAAEHSKDSNDPKNYKDSKDSNDSYESIGFRDSNVFQRCKEPSPPIPASTQPTQHQNPSPPGLASTPPVSLDPLSPAPASNPPVSLDPCSPAPASNVPLFPDPLSPNPLSPGFASKPPLSPDLLSAGPDSAQAMSSSPLSPGLTSTPSMSSARSSRSTSKPPLSPTLTSTTRGAGAGGAGASRELEQLLVRGVLAPVGSPKSISRQQSDVGQGSSSRAAAGPHLGCCSSTTTIISPSPKKAGEGPVDLGFMISDEDANILAASLFEQSPQPSPDIRPSSRMSLSSRLSSNSSRGMPSPSCASFSRGAPSPTLAPSASRCFISPRSSVTYKPGANLGSIGSDVGELHRTQGRSRVYRSSDTNSHTRSPEALSPTAPARHSVQTPVGSARSQGAKTGNDGDNAGGNNRCPVYAALYDQGTCYGGFLAREQPGTSTATSIRSLGHMPGAGTCYGGFLAREQPGTLTATSIRSLGGMPGADDDEPVPRRGMRVNAGFHLDIPESMFDVSYLPQCKSEPAVGESIEEHEELTSIRGTASQAQPSTYEPAFRNNQPRTALRFKSISMQRQDEGSALSSRTSISAPFQAPALPVPFPASTPSQVLPSPAPPPSIPNPARDSTRPAPPPPGPLLAPSPANAAHALLITPSHGQNAEHTSAAGGGPPVAPADEAATAAMASQGSVSRDEKAPVSAAARQLPRSSSLQPGRAPPPPPVQRVGSTQAPSIQEGGVQPGRAPPPPPIQKRVSSTQAPSIQEGSVQPVPPQQDLPSPSSAGPSPRMSCQLSIPPPAQRVSCFDGSVAGRATSAAAQDTGEVFDDTLRLNSVSNADAGADAADVRSTPRARSEVGDAVDKCLESSGSPGGGEGAVSRLSVSSHSLSSHGSSQYATSQVFLNSLRSMDENLEVTSNDVLVNQMENPSFDASPPSTVSSGTKSLLPLTSPRTPEQSPGWCNRSMSNASPSAMSLEHGRSHIPAPWADSGGSSSTAAYMTTTPSSEQSRSQPSLTPSRLSPLLESGTTGQVVQKAIWDPFTTSPSGVNTLAGGLAPRPDYSAPYHTTLPSSLSLEGGQSLGGGEAGGGTAIWDSFTTSPSSFNTLAGGLATQPDYSAPHHTTLPSSSALEVGQSQEGGEAGGGTVINVPLRQFVAQLAARGEVDPSDKIKVFCMMHVQPSDTSPSSEPSAQPGETSASSAPDPQGSGMPVVVNPDGSMFMLLPVDHAERKVEALKEVERVKREAEARRRQQEG
eukprot:gene18491-24989_t